MKCPIDDNELSMTDRQGIEIDFCPKCRGVWLDRGELDKIIERSGAGASDSRVEDHEQRRYQEPQSNRSSHHDNDNDYDDRRHHDKKHKKEGFLGDLFDF